MPSRIFSARFIKDGLERIIKLFDLTQSEYQEKYRGDLYCPNSGCDAKIVFASGDVRKHFRTYPVRSKDGKIISQHVAGCEYSVEHELEERERRRRDPENKIAISSEHMLRTLKRTHDKLVNPEKSKKDKEVPEIKQKSPRTKSKGASKVSSIAGIVSSGAIEGTGREPAVYHRSVDELGDKDYYYTRAVDGYIQDMVFGNDYTYINLSRNDHLKARVLFSEAFAVNSPGIDNMVYKNYIDICKEKGDVPLVCIGEVRREDDELNIVIDSFEALMINGKRYFGIVNEFNEN